ncbi:hypothetical protein LCGC14_0500940 [marine sediment metagenome]|uniref:Uncharacterized protein n=1 Tax=marine sediment metagenome TaxID=412755 RepID=A0A0F9S8X9_9ZZZZ
MNTLEDTNIKKTEYSGYTLLAAGATWKDKTSYSRNVQLRQPNIFELQLDGLRIFITIGHINYNGIWIMGCYELNIKEVECRDCKTATQAAEYAIKSVRFKLDKMRNSLSTIKNQKSND